MKEWWARLKEWNDERQKIADANLLAMVRAIEQMQFERFERREARKLMLRELKESGVPTFSGYVLFFLLPEYCRELLLGDLLEECSLLKLGKLRAYVYIHRQVLCSIWPIVQQCIRAGDGAWLFERIVWAGFAVGAGVLFYGLIGEAGVGDPGFLPFDVLGFPLVPF